MAGSGYIKGKERIDLTLGTEVEVVQSTAADLNATVDVATLAANTIDLGAGAVSAGTQRTTLASDDPAVAVLGATADAGVTTDAVGSLSAKLRGLVTLIAARIPALGAALGAASSPVTLATDDTEVLAIGAVADASIVTDTTGSISGKLRGLVALVSARLPTLGQKAAAGSVPVVHAGVASALVVSGAIDNMGSDVTSTSLDVAGYRTIGVEIHVDNTDAIGLIYLEVTNASSVWAPVTLSSGLNYINVATGVDVEAVVDLADMGAAYFRVRYDRTSGDGKLNVNVFAK